MRAGQRPPDRRTAYGPPPLVKAAALSARECPKPDGSGARSGGTMATRATASAGMTGNGLRRGRRQEPSPAGRKPYGLGEPTPGGPSPPSKVAGGPPLRVHRHRPPRGKQRLTIERQASGPRLGQYSRGSSDTHGHSQTQRAHNLRERLRWLPTIRSTDLPNWGLLLSSRPLRCAWPIRD